MAYKYKMKTENKYYVYFHMKEGQIVYIGKGSGGRAWNTARTNDYHSEWLEESILNNTNFVHMAATRLGEKEAYDLESSLIAQHKPIYNHEYDKGKEPILEMTGIFRKDT